MTKRHLRLRDRPAAKRARESIPWIVKAYERAPVAPVWIGLAAALTLSVVFATLELALGRHLLLPTIPAGEDPFRNVRLAVLHIFLLAYGPTAYLVVSQGARRTFRALRPMLEGSKTELARLERSAGAYPLLALRIAGGIGVVMMLAMPALVDRTVATYDPRTWNVEMLWHRIPSPFIGWFLMRTFYAQLAESRRLSRLAERLAPIDLFDLRPLAPFTRQGLTHALLSVVFLALCSPVLLEWGFAEIFAVLGGATVVVAVASFVLSVWGVRARIHQAKHAALEVCEAALRRARSGSRAKIAPAQLAQLTDLLAYRQHVQAVREWPFDASTVLRFAAYLLIPLVSWSGAALVERLIDAFLE